MKKFSTLVWLEHRRNWLWSLPLMGSLLFWAWGIKQVTVMDVGERLAIRAGLLMGAAAIGTVLLVIMIGRIRSETRNGQYQVLLMSPPSGYTHILARFAYAAGVALAYLVAIGAMFWWILELAGIQLDARSLVDLMISMPIYAMTVAVLPILAYTLLLMVFISAYRLAGAGWIPGTVMLIGTPIAMQYIGDWTSGWLWKLPGWQVFERVQAAVFERLAQADIGASFLTATNEGGYSGMPIEPMLIMLVLTAIMLLLAGRIWQEVEA